jgi:hypothetical protein
MILAVMKSLFFAFRELFARRTCLLLEKHVKCKYSDIIVVISTRTSHCYFVNLESSNNKDIYDNQSCSHH